MNEIALRLTQHLRAEASRLGDLSIVLHQLALAGKLLARELSRAALIGQLGQAGRVNIQGEQVKKLDLWANETVVRALEASGLVGVVVSEEMDEPLYLGEGRYVVCIDPVVGSSNLDVNGIVGTIFSVRPRRSDGRQGARDDAMQPGTAQVAAGYIMYGPSTVLVYTAGGGVHAFVLESSLGEFIQWTFVFRIAAASTASTTPMPPAGPTGSSVSSSICAPPTRPRGDLTRRATWDPWWLTSTARCWRAGSSCTRR
jgi:fructose-1,6-bisphosphatase I